MVSTSSENRLIARRTFDSDLQPAAFKVQVFGERPIEKDAEYRDAPDILIQKIRLMAAKSLYHLESVAPVVGREVRNPCSAMRKARAQRLRRPVRNDGPCGRKLFPTLIARIPIVGNLRPQHRKIKSDRNCLGDYQCGKVPSLSFSLRRAASPLPQPIPNPTRPLP